MHSNGVEVLARRLVRLRTRARRCWQWGQSRSPAQHVSAWIKSITRSRSAPRSAGEVVERLDHGERLLRGPVGRNPERDCEAASGRSRRRLRGLAHRLPRFRCRARCSERSRASLRRYESPSRAMISALWTSRSTSETTQAALGKTSLHSANGRFNAEDIVMRAPDFERPAIPRFWSRDSPHKGGATRQRSDQFIARPEPPGA